MNDALEIVGAVGGGIAALACLIAAIAYFRNDNVGAGVGLLVLSPIAFFVGGFLAALLAALAVLAFIFWILTIDK